MYTSITDVVSRFKSNWAKELLPERIHEECSFIGYKWRNRVLNPVSIIQLFLLQILNGNTALSHLRHLSGIKFSASAFCQARKKIPLALLRRLLEQVSTSVHEESSRWLGHRIFFTDGSYFSMPDTGELQKHFGQPRGQKAGCGFPVAHLFAMFHAGTGMVLRVLTAPLYSHDLAWTVKFHPELSADDVIVGDRAYCSYGYLAHILSHKLHAVTRVARVVINFKSGRAFNKKGKALKAGLPSSRWLKKLGIRDQLVEWYKPKNPPQWMSDGEYENVPNSIVVRELRYQVKKNGFRTSKITLVTTLTDSSKYLKNELADLYKARWNAETNFAHLKTTMGMDVLRCKTVDGILKELHAFCIVYNLVRLVMIRAAALQKVEFSRISFIDALRWLASLPQNQELESLLVIPIREGRQEPRVKKRRPNQYDLMRTPRQFLKNKLEKHVLTA